MFGNRDGDHLGERGLRQSYNDPNKVRIILEMLGIQYTLGFIHMVIRNIFIPSHLTHHIRKFDVI